MNKQYEVRYYSEMVQGMALHSEHSTIQKAREEASAFAAHVKQSSCDPRSKAQILKTIQVS